jgi:HAD superfamily hydrolase (TIGR01509 family)
MIPTALIFDVDGTLAETEEAHRLAFNRAFTEFGLPWEWDRALYRDLLRISGGRERMAAYAKRLGATGLDDRLAALHRRKTELYTRGVAAGEVPLRPGIACLIAEAAAAGVVLAIATTTSRANVEALLGDGLAQFAVVACAEDAPVKKPDPAVYTLVLDRLGLSAAVCLALEDSSNGVRAACAAGIAVVVSESVYTKGDDFTGARAVYPDFGGVGLAELARLAP